MILIIEYELVFSVSFIIEGIIVRRDNTEEAREPSPKER